VGKPLREVERIMDAADALIIAMVCWGFRLSAPYPGRILEDGDPGAGGHAQCHQNNTLILGPGASIFGEYWRIGLPTDLLVIAVALPMLLWVWPW
jgi:hypothetical protein